MTDLDAIADIARDHDIDPAALQALAIKESGGRFLISVDGDARPVILPEQHYFHGILEGSALASAVKLGLASPVPGGYPRTYRACWERFDAMARVDRSAAIRSCSWGWGQVMGDHYAALGFDTPQDLFVAAHTVEGQTALVIGYLRTHDLIDAINRLGEPESLRAFAIGYNGPQAIRRGYDRDLAAIWRDLRAGGDGRLGGGKAKPSEALRRVQTGLRRLGYNPGAADGISGPRTAAAVMAFQRSRGLIADGIAGPRTEDALRTALDALALDRKADRENIAAGTGGGAAAVVLGCAQVAAEAGVPWGWIIAAVIALGVGAAAFMAWRLIRARRERAA